MVLNMIESERAGRHTVAQLSIDKQAGELNLNRIYVSVRFLSVQIVPGCLNGS